MSHQNTNTNTKAIIQGHAVGQAPRGMMATIGGRWWWVRHQDLKRECSDGSGWSARGGAHFSAVAPIVSNQMVECWVSVNPPSPTLEPTSKKSGMAENHKARVSVNSKFLGKSRWDSRQRSQNSQIIFRASLANFVIKLNHFHIWNKPGVQSHLKALCQVKSQIKETKLSQWQNCKQIEGTGCRFLIEYKSKILNPDQYFVSEDLDLANDPCFRTGMLW